MQPWPLHEAVKPVASRVETSVESVVVDCHVHFYDFYDETRFFESAAHNLQRGAAQLGITGACSGCLVLTESWTNDHFERFSRRADQGPGRTPWMLRSTAERTSLIACHEDGRQLALIAGRQVATAERLEVLALASSEAPEDGFPIRDVLRKTAETGTLAVLPWGFGKWWFRRGQLLRRLLEERDSLFLADSGCRLRYSGYPRILRLAEAGSHFVLAGSDPLPIAGHEARAGSYGFEVEGPLDWRAPAAWLAGRLRNLASSPRVFGELQRLGTFWRSQLAMQIRRQPAGRGR